MSPPEPCCRAFAAAHADPETLLRERPGLDLEALGRSRTGAPLTTTARALLLRRDGLVQHGDEQVLGPEGWMLAPWHHDTYCGGLGLLEAAPVPWARVRVLDVGAGLGIFPTEASALGALVDATDAEVDDAHASFAAARGWVTRHYAEQVARLRCLSQHAKLPRYAMDEVATGLLEQVHQRRGAIGDAYPSVSGRRFADDARTLTTVDDARYDLVLCGWLMTHLTETDEQQVLGALVRVTRAGGRVHIKAGWGADATERYASWLGSTGRVGGRDVRIGAGSAGDRVVLHIG